MKNNLLTVGLVAFVIIVLGLASTQAMQSNDRSNKADDYKINRKCDDKEIIVDIGGVNLVIPRTALISTEDGVSVSYERRCDTKSVNDVVEAGLARPEYFRFSTLKTRTTYDIEREYILTAEGNGNTEILAGGVKKIKKAGTEIYIFPAQELLTANSEPIVFYCLVAYRHMKFTAETCSTSYQHPAGFVVKYMFFRKDFPEDKYLDIAIQRYNKVTSMLKKTK